MGAPTDLPTYLPTYLPLGVQECLMLDALRAAIHEHLGGPGRYEGFARQIGDANILNGMIALVRAEAQDGRGLVPE